MNKVKLLVTIIPQNEKEVQIVKNTTSEITNVFNISFLGRGTAKKSLLRYLGLSEVEKEVVLSLISEVSEEEVLKNLNKNLKLYLQGRGIAFTIKLSSISKILNNAITLSLKQKNMEEPKMVENKYDLIVACINPSYIDKVVEATRIAGATGGTIINARSIDNSRLEEFLGTTIQQEQEILLILALKSTKNEIMNAILEVSGFKTTGGAILFSLPVDNLIGIGQIEEE